MCLSAYTKNNKQLLRFWNVALLKDISTGIIATIGLIISLTILLNFTMLQPRSSSSFVITGYLVMILGGIITDLMLVRYYSEKIRIDELNFKQHYSGSKTYPLSNGYVILFDDDSITARNHRYTLQPTAKQLYSLANGTIIGLTILFALVTQYPLTHLVYISFLLVLVSANLAIFLYAKFRDFYQHNEEDTQDTAEMKDNMELKIEPKGREFKIFTPSSLISTPEKGSLEMVVGKETFLNCSIVTREDLFNELDHSPPVTIRFGLLIDQLFRGNYYYLAITPLEYYHEINHDALKQDLQQGKYYNLTNSRDRYELEELRQEIETWVKQVTS